MKTIALALTVAFALTAPSSAQAEPSEHHAGGDTNKTYYFLGSKKASRLVLAMPGGNGQAKDFLPWMTKIQTSLGEDYAVAVLSAPQWNERQAQNVVWVTDYSKKNSCPEAEFTTEEFLEAVYADVKKSIKLKVKPAQVAILAWSSSGPAAYSAAGTKKSPFERFLILSSVFKPNQIPKLSETKGKQFFLLQGTEDTVTRLSWAQEADKALTEAKAEVTLIEFDGGHGFAMTDPLGTLKSAFGQLFE